MAPPERGAQPARGGWAVPPKSVERRLHASQPGLDATRVNPALAKFFYAFYSENGREQAQEPQKLAIQSLPHGALD
jgi:hypothetical protein